MVETDHMFLKKTVNLCYIKTQRENGTYFVEGFIVQVVTNSITYINRQKNIILFLEKKSLNKQHHTHQKKKTPNKQKRKTKQNKKKPKKKTPHAENDANQANGTMRRYVNSVLNCVKC